MICKINDKFYILLNKGKGYEYYDADNEIKIIRTEYNLRNITNGEELIIRGTEEEVAKFQVKITDALPTFFDAQWIGKPDAEKMTIAMMQEVGEALNELDWKPWKPVEPDMEKYLGELSDVGIFLLLCVKTAGFTLEDLIMGMMKKHLYNLVRTDHKSRVVED